MEQFEKVVKGLECDFSPNQDCFAMGCPYTDWIDCRSKVQMDALALIRKQQKRIAELEAAQQWISVTDRLPERPENWPHCEIKRCYFLVALKSGCVESLGFDFADMRWHITGSPVTHWMPLPKPPKEEP